MNDSELQVAILFYSEHSPMCASLFDFLQNYQLASIEYISVDSKQVKEQLLNNKDLNIRYVPTLLLIYTNHKIEKIEREKVFHWFKMIIDSHHTMMEQTPTPKTKKKKQKGYQYTPVPIDVDTSAMHNPVRKIDPFPPIPESDSESESDEEKDDEEDPFGMLSSYENTTPDSNSSRGDGTGGKQSKDVRNPIMDVAAQMASARTRETEDDENKLKGIVGKKKKSKR